MIVLIAALDPENGIGKDGKLPWHIKDDLNLFKEKTLNHKIVMGRRTFESIGRVLPKRINLVVSRDDKYKNLNDIITINNLEEFLKANENTEELIYIIGGEDIYRQALPYAKRLALSFIKNNYECDTFFPSFNFDEYKEIESLNFEQFKYSLLEKK
jgi:dihydrofolate reductase